MTVSNPPLEIGVIFLVSSIIISILYSLYEKYKDYRDFKADPGNIIP